MVLDTAFLIKECRYENHIGQRIYTHQKAGYINAFTLITKILKICCF
mgnify:CR=1 FL=1